MEGPIKERWEELCRQAAEEKDPKRLLELTTEINRLLREKENRLRAQREPNLSLCGIEREGNDRRKVGSRAGIGEKYHSHKSDD